MLKYLTQILKFVFILFLECWFVSFYPCLESQLHRLTMGELSGLFLRNAQVRLLSNIPLVGWFFVNCVDGRRGSKNLNFQRFTTKYQTNIVRFTFSPLIVMYPIFYVGDWNLLWKNTWMTELRWKKLKFMVVTDWYNNLYGRALKHAATIWLLIGLSKGGYINCVCGV